MNLVIDVAEWYGKLAQESSNSPQNEFFLEAARQIRASEAWKSGHEEEPTPQSTKEMGSEIMLPRPFQTAKPYLYRKGDIYSVEFQTTLKQGAHQNKDISNIIKGMEPQLIKKYGDKWAKISDSYGFVLDEDGEPCVAMGLDTSGTHYEVLIGERGTKQRIFGTLDDFTKDMNIFGTAINNAVNAGIDSAVELKMLESNPRLKLILR